jgi:transposase
VHADRLHGRLRAHKHAGEVLAFYKQIRMRYPHRLRTYLIADNLSTHKTPDIRRWADNNNIELVFTPTYTSFLNRIECHFWGIGEFVINNADYLSLNQRLIAAERKLLIAA